MGSEVSQGRPRPRRQGEAVAGLGRSADRVRLKREESIRPPIEVVLNGFDGGLCYQVGKRQLFVACSYKNQ